MGISATTGLVSGTDYSTLISSLITAESQAIEPVKDKKTAAEEALEAVQEISLNFSYVAIDTETFIDEATFRKRTATPEDEDLFSATASSDASAGSYEIRIDALAQAEQKIGSAVDTDSTFTGTLTIQVGDGETFSYDAADVTLASLAETINNSTTAGVTAQVVAVGDGTSRLMLTADDSGAENTITLGGDLATSGPFAEVTTLTNAQDASITMRIGTDSTIEITRTSSTNSITDIVEGVDLALKQTTDDFSTLTIAADSSATVNYISQFIEDLNTALSSYAAENTYDSATETGGVLFNNSIIRNSVNALHAAMQTISSSGSSLEDLGITYDYTTGQYDLDEDVLQTLVDGDPDALAAIFIDDGFGELINNAMLGLTDEDDGVLVDEEDSLNESIDAYEERITKFEESIEEKRSRYQAQFLALETTLAKLDSQKSVLTSFIDGLNSSSE